MAARKRAAINTSDVPAVAATTVDLASNIKSEDIDRPDLAVVTDDTLASPHVAEYIKDLKFMEDILTIQIADTNDKNAERVVPCGVNGEVKFLERGKELKIARKFVDSLIKVEDRIETEQYKDKNGVDQTRVNKTPALKYPLSIIHDPAGDLGRRWFQHQCRNAG